MHWSNIFVLLPIAVVIFGAYDLRKHYRKYRLEQVVWFRFANSRAYPWQLAIVISLTEYPSVFHVRTFGEGRMHIVGRYELRPIRWWQRNKVDPIVMKYWLLEHGQ
jgi:hypothetical protein